MNEETNENIKDNGTDNNIQYELENAFSELFSEYFDEENTETNTENDTTTGGNTVVEDAGNLNLEANGITVTPIVEGDIPTNSGVIADGVVTPTNGGVNLEGYTAPTGEGVNAEGYVAPTSDGVSEEEVTTANEVTTPYAKTTGKLYTNLGVITGVKLTSDYTGTNSEATSANSGSVYGKVNIEKVPASANTGSIDTIATPAVDDKEFKITQSNLPAKISIWTKIRNFFVTDVKMEYDVETPETESKGFWGKVHNFFSFGKNK